MGFYDLTKDQRIEKTAAIQADCHEAFVSGNDESLLNYFADEDTYIRKAAYQATGKIYFANLQLQTKIVQQLHLFAQHPNEKIRQTTINTAGEIGMFYFDDVVAFFDTGLFDSHPNVRNAVIGSMKKMGEKNPKPVLQWSQKYLKHPDKEVRREICHGIELRGRTHPEEVLPLLQQLEHDTTSRVRKTLVHVLGQISYKKNCLPKVIEHLNHWENRKLVQDAAAEIVDVHSEKRYAKFTALTQQQVIDYIQKNLKP